MAIEMFILYTPCDNITRPRQMLEIEVSFCYTDHLNILAENSMQKVLLFHKGLRTILTLKVCYLIRDTRRRARIEK